MDHKERNHEHHNLPELNPLDGLNGSPLTIVAKPTLTLDDLVPFKPPMEFQKCTKIIRSSFKDLPSFSKDAVVLISKLVGDTVEELVEKAYGEMGGEEGRKLITAKMLKEVVTRETHQFDQFLDLVGSAKLEPKFRRKANG
ncbi:hypothetical protein TrRE_jg3041, partial [Triparma retinervis]